MPRDNIVLGLRGYKIKRLGGGNPVELEVHYTGAVVAGPFRRSIPGFTLFR